MEQRSCAHCGKQLRVNTRACETHHYCAAAECQRERRRLAQRARRACSPAPPSEASRASAAAYMKSYRESHAPYRQREREAAERRRNEAGSSDLPAKVYLVSGPGSAVRLRVVSEGGLVVTMKTDAPSEPASSPAVARRNEAG